MKYDLDVLTEESRQQQVDGEKRLARSVLAQAIKDLYLAPAYREQAIAFLEDDRSPEEVMSFHWVCDQLGYN